MKTRRKREWFEDESFWIEMYPFLFHKKRFADAFDQIEKILKLVKPVGKKVLDLCCGPGRCAIPLAKKGFAVTGVDRTKFLLKKARAKARYAKVKIEWVRQDMRDFVRPEAFGLVVNMFTSFGYFDRREDDMQVLKNIFANLKPGGSCVLDVMGKERLARIFQGTSCGVLDDGTKLVQRHEIFDDWTRVRNEWILIRNGRAKTFKFHHTIYSGQELRDRLEGAGFHKVKLYGNLDGEEYGPDAQRLIAVAQKPGASKARAKRRTRGREAKSRSTKVRK